MVQRSPVRAMLVLFCILLTYAGQQVAAATLRGTIRDTKGETLPFATVYIEGTTTGTTSNASGSYSLQLPGAGSFRIICQYIGFEKTSANIVVRDVAEMPVHDFVLREQQLGLAEVVVKGGGEDPAYAIIRKAISRRVEHLKQVRSFQTDIYLKGVLRLRDAPKTVFGIKVNDDETGGTDSGGKGVLYLCEEVASYYAEEPSKSRTVIHSVRESGDPNGLGFATLPSVISFYENNIELGSQLAPRGYVSPIADGAISFYRYRFRGEFREGKHTIFKIQVTPRRLYEPLFEGYVYIVDKDWALHSLSLSATRRNALEFLDTLRLDQVYLPLRHDTWVIKNQVFYPTISLLGFEGAGNFVTVYDNQKVNEPVPDGIFSKKIISSYDSTAQSRDTTYWAATRPIDLEADEIRDYHIKDSMALARKSDPGKQDSLRRRGNRIKLMDFVLNGVHHSGKGGRSSWSTNSLVWMTNYNTVEGLNLSPRFTYNRMVDSSSTLVFRTALRYGFSNNHFNAIGGLTYTRRDRSWATRNWSIGLSGGKYVFQYAQQNPVEPLFNTFSTLLYRQNYLKIYERYEGTLNASRNWGNGLRAAAKISFQERLPLENTTAYDWAESGRGPLTPNIPAELSPYGFERHRAAIAGVAIWYKPGYRYIQYPKFRSPVSGRWPTFSATYSKAIAGIAGSKADWDRWSAGISDETSLRLLGRLSYNLIVGGFVNRRYVGIPDLNHFYGNQYILSSPYLRSFQLMPYYRYSNREKMYAEGHLEHNLQGLITNKIPLLRQAQWYFILGGNGLYMNRDFWYGEAFISIDNLGYKAIRFLRVDFVQGWDGAGRRYSGIRAGLRLGSLIKVTPDNGEW